MTPEEQRIRLAEFVGWTYTNQTWWPPKRTDGSQPRWCKDPPDPFNNANDCEALIRKLQTIGWFIEVVFQTYDSALRSDLLGCGGDFTVDIHIWNIDTEEHFRTDRDAITWKAGVCELAIRALNDN